MVLGDSGPLLQDAGLTCWVASTHCPPVLLCLQEGLGGRAHPAAMPVLCQLEHTCLRAPRPGGAQARGWQGRPCPGCSLSHVAQVALQPTAGGREGLLSRVVLPRCRGVPLKGQAPSPASPPLSPTPCPLTHTMSSCGPEHGPRHGLWPGRASLHKWLGQALVTVRTKVPHALSVGAWRVDALPSVFHRLWSRFLELAAGPWGFTGTSCLRS